MKAIKWIAVILIIISFIFILGTAGSSDAGVIDDTEAFVRCLFGLVMSGVGAVTIYIIEEKESKKK